MLLPAKFFTRSPTLCAAEMIGCELVWGECGGLVVETEAYHAIGDEACHTFARAGARAFVESNPAGTAYVYMSYGVHWLLNVLVKGRDEQDDGFVLIRALRPVRGIERMRKRRGLEQERLLCSGPGRLTEALGVTGAVHGSNLCGDPAHGFHFAPKNAMGAKVEVAVGIRVGISRSAHLPWRFLWKDSRYVSRPIPRQGT